MRLCQTAIQLRFHFSGAWQDSYKSFSKNDLNFLILATPANLSRSIASCDDASCGISFVRVHHHNCSRFGNTNAEDFRHDDIT